MNAQNTQPAKKDEQRFHKMNDVIMKITKVYMDWHDEEQDFGVNVNLRRAEIHTIQAIGNAQQMNITQLAQTLDVKKPTVSERINRLARQGLVLKSPHESNNKEVILSLTPKGWTAYENHEEKHHQLYKNFVDYFGAEAGVFLDGFTQSLERFDQFITHLES